MTKEAPQDKVEVLNRSIPGRERIAFRTLEKTAGPYPTSYGNGTKEANPFRLLSRLDKFPPLRIYADIALF